MRDIVACPERSRRDERRGDRGASLQPSGLTAAMQHLLRCRSSTMWGIACVAAPRICRLGAVNGTPDFSDTRH